MKMRIHEHVLRNDPGLINRSARAGTTVVVQDSDENVLYTVVPEGAEKPPGDLKLSVAALITGFALGVLVVNLVMIGG